MTEEKQPLTAEQIEKTALLLAYEFKKVLGSKTWFKPIHISRQIGQTEGFVKSKLELLAQLDYVKVKKMPNGEIKYSIVITKEQRAIYLTEVLRELKFESDEIKKEIDSIRAELNG
jgi:hypothetical protein